MLSYCTFHVSPQSTGQLTACLEMTVQHRFLEGERLPGWNDFSCAPASFTLPKGEAFWIQLPMFKKKSMFCAFYHLTHSILLQYYSV